MFQGRDPVRHVGWSPCNTDGVRRQQHTGPRPLHWKSRRLSGSTTAAAGFTTLPDAPRRAPAQRGVGRAVRDKLGVQAQQRARPGRLVAPQRRERGRQQRRAGRLQRRRGAQRAERRPAQHGRGRGLAARLRGRRVQRLHLLRPAHANTTSIPSRCFATLSRIVVLDYGHDGHRCALQCAASQVSAWHSRSICRSASAQPLSPSCALATPGARSFPPSVLQPPPHVCQCSRRSAHTLRRCHAATVTAAEPVARRTERQLQCTAAAAQACPRSKR